MRILLTRRAEIALRSLSPIDKKQIVHSLQNLNDNVAKISIEHGSEKVTIIPPAVAVSEQIPEYESDKIVFSFVPYKQSQCEIYKLEKTEAKKLTERLRRINQTLTKNILCQQISGIPCKSVGRGGSYVSLFEDLPPDVQLLEVDYTGTGRIFGYLSDNIFNIVSIKRDHLR